MVRTVDRDYLVQLVDQYYNEQEENFLFCDGLNCPFCKNQCFLRKESGKKINSLNSDVNVWKISYYKNYPSILTIFLVHKNK